MYGSFVKDEYKNIWMSILPPIMCFIVTFCWFGIFACMGVDVHADGIMLKPATDVANGQVLFRDTFTQYGALTTFIQALALKMFGQYLIVIRLTTVLFYSLSAVLLYYIWRNFLTPAFFWIMYGLFLLLPPFYGLTFLPWSSIYALFFILLANVFMIGFIKRGFVWLLWGAGASSALAFWCRQPTGIVMYLALFLYFAVCLALERKSWRRILINFGICTAAYLICSMCFLIYLWLNDALADWYIQSIRFMFTFGIEGREATSLFKCLFPASVFRIIPIVTLSVLCVSLYLLFNKKRDGDRPINRMLVVTAIIGLASWHQYFPVPCALHLCWAAIPMLGFYVYVIQRIVDFPVERILMPLSVQLPRSSRLLLAMILMNLMLIIVAIIGLASWYQYFPAYSWDYCSAAALMLGVYAFAIKRIISFPIEDMPMYLSKPLIYLLNLLLAVILMMPFYSMLSKMAKGVTVSLTNLPERQVFIDSPLKYMLLSHEEYRFFQSFRFIMGQMPPEFAGRRWINLTPNAFYALYFPNGNNFFPMHVNWGNSVYPDYFDKVNHVLADVRPIVISYDKLDVPGYKLFAVIEKTEPKIIFHLPGLKANSQEQVLEKKRQGDSVIWQIPASLSQRLEPFSMPLYFYLPVPEDSKQRTDGR